MKPFFPLSLLFLLAIPLNSQILRPASNVDFWTPVMLPECSLAQGTIPAKYDSISTIARAFEIHSEDFNLPVYCLEVLIDCLRPEIVNKKRTTFYHPSLPPRRIWLFMYPDGIFLPKKDVKELIRNGEAPFPQKITNP
jgi:hypothetical protein